MADFDRSSRKRLNRHATRFYTGETLFARLGRAVCEAEAISRKEFFETWEVARRVRKRLGGQPVFELAAGHGLLAMLMIILDDSIPTATCVDKTMPLSHERLTASLEKTWPRLAGRVTFRECPVAQVELPPEAMVVSVHGCGTLTDEILRLAVSARCPVAVLPCCHDLSKCEDGGLRGWMEPTLAIDANRAARLSLSNYRVVATTIPEDITPRNRLLIGWPR